MPSVGTPARDALAHQLVEAELAQALIALREGADAGDDQPVGRRAARSWSALRSARAPTCASAFSTERRLPMP